VALGLLGLILATSLIGWFGFKDILRATLSVGVPGFLAVCAFQTALFALLGLCWYVLLPALPLWLAIWGRMVRDASGQLLPLSLVGGFVFGTRAVSFFGVPAPQAIASTVVDLTAEFLAQIGLVAIGLVLLAARTPGARLILPVGLGLIACLGIGAAFIWLQRRQESPVLRLSHMLLGRTIPGLDHELVAVQHALAAIYAAPWRVAWSTALHLLAWFGTGFASYLAFRLLGARIDFASALGIEALLHAMLAGAILVPGYAGVQEAAYAAVGVLFGQPPALALAVSLLRRARDVALGVPILLLWQGMELKRRREAAPRIAG
jgi:putative membrane protein